MMRSWRVIENIELGKSWSSLKESEWPRFFLLFAITGPVGFFAMKFIIRLIKAWSGNGLGFFEAEFILCGFWMVFKFYRWAIKKVM